MSDVNFDGGSTPAGNGADDSAGNNIPGDSGQFPLEGSSEVAAFADLTANSDDSTLNAGNDIASTRVGVSLEIDVVTNDTDRDGETFRIMEVDNGAHGSVFVTGNGTLVYVPDAGFSGADTFSYRIQNESGDIDSATVSVAVAPPGQENALVIETSTDLSAGVLPDVGLSERVQNLGRPATTAEADEFAYQFSNGRDSFRISGTGSDLSYDENSVVTAGELESVTFEYLQKLTGGPILNKTTTFAGLSDSVQDTANENYWSDLLDGANVIMMRELGTSHGYAYSVAAGDGDDVVATDLLANTQFAPAFTVDLGAGNDQLNLGITNRPFFVTLGDGSDTVRQEFSAETATGLGLRTIHDFDPSEDRIELAPGDGGSADVLAQLELVSIDGGTELRDATTNQSYMVLEGVDATELQYADGVVSGSSGTTGDLIDDIADETQYLTGTGSEIFVIDGNSSDYSWGPTEDREGIVVWSGESFDLLYGFGAIRFQDTEVPLAGGTSTDVEDIAGRTQYLAGTDGQDRFIINGNASDYGWSATGDGTGIVVWNDEGHDILWEFEQLVFNDEAVDIGGRQVTEYLDTPGATQYLEGTDGTDRFVVDGNSADYGWDRTEDNTGFVVWNDEGHDILWDFEEILFNDGLVELDAGSGMD